MDQQQDPNVSLIKAISKKGTLQKFIIVENYTAFRRHKTN